MRGSITIAAAPLAPNCFTVWASTCSAFAWIWWSIVRVTFFPGRSGRDVTTSIARPNGSFTIVSDPARPDSVLSSERSSPSSPWLSVPAKPSTCAATRPCGYVRSSSG